MPAVKVGIATRTLGRPLRAGLQAASRTEADGVELDLRNELKAAELSDSAVRELRKLLADLRLTLGAVAFPTRRGFSDEQQLDRRVAATRLAMAVGKKLGAGVVVLGVGHVPDADDPRGALLRDTLTGLARHADHVGVRLALQTGADDTLRLPELFGSLPDELAGVSLDPGALIAEGREPAAALDALGARLVHVYACDAVRDFSTRGAAAVELGRGSVEWPELLGRLEEHNYRGWLFIKHRAAADDQELDNAVAFLRAV